MGAETPNLLSQTTYKRQVEQTAACWSTVKRKASEETTQLIYMAPFKWTLKGDNFLQKPLTTLHETCPHDIVEVIEKFKSH